MNRAAADADKKKPKKAKKEPVRYHALLYIDCERVSLFSLWYKCASPLGYTGTAVRFIYSQLTLQLSRI